MDGNISNPDLMEEIVAEFRLYSFHVYYDKMFAAERNTTLRFAKALVASTAPIRDTKLVMQWWNSPQRKETQYDRTSGINRAG
jgi:hypothetical protein